MLLNHGRSFSDKSDLKAKDEPDDSALTLDLGEVKAKETTTKPFKVRGPAAFRIIGWRGSDAQMKVEAHIKGRDAHEVTLTLQPEQAGDFRRTIYLYTDLPGRAEVAVRVQARAIAAP